MANDRELNLQTPPEGPPAEQSPQRRGPLGPLLIILVLLAAGFLLWRWYGGAGHASQSELLSHARALLKGGDAPAAAELAGKAVRQQDGSSEAWFVLGLAERAAARPHEAVAAFDRVDGDSQWALQARVQTGEVLFFDLHRMSDAEQQFRRALTIEPENPAALERLIQILMTSGRWDEAAPSVLRLIRQGQFHNLHLYVLCAGDRVEVDVETLPQYVAADPDDPAPRVALAMHAASQQRWDDASELLRSVLQDHPDRCEAQAEWAIVRSQSLDESELRTWFGATAVQCDRSSRYWAAAGDWAAAAGSHRAAIRCYWESLLREPSQPLVNYRLGRQLLQADQPELSQLFLDRAALLQEYLSAVEVAKSGSDLPLLNRTVDLAEQLGLDWEAYGWASLSLRLKPELEWARDVVRRIGVTVADRPLIRTDARANLAARVDLSEFAFPGGTGGVSPRDGQVTGAISPDSMPTIRFTNRAADLGIEFQYRNGGDSSQGLRYMYELLGGGVGVVDYDRDGWPDLYLTQGSDWPPAPDQRRYLDRMYRNVAGEQARDVTAAARLIESGFSQGVAVADLDADGFSDIYVANIGRNRCFRNNGDGTFSEIEDAMGTAGEDWSSSCLFDDLNGDGLPDLYVVNYLQGADVFSRLCPDQSGELRLSCSQKEFAAAQDRLYFNSGGRGFRDATETAGILSPEGRGLGILSLRLNAFSLPTLFVANDSDANNFFVPQSGNDAAGGNLDVQYVDEAWARGVAVDGQGRGQACMGIASGDVDGDQRLDLLVSNFDGETSTLYRQVTDGSFEDATRVFRLADDSFPMVGFGAQFLDADLDGHLDLFITNGHVNDLRAKGRLYTMPPQLYWNRDGRDYRLCPEGTGAYFGGSYLGRSAARLDWDQDGRADLAVTHLDAPAALLLNETQTSHHVLSLRFVGVQSDRNGTGVRIRIQFGGNQAAFELTAGDGYLCSNERALWAGLNRHSVITRLAVIWPSGVQDHYADVRVDEPLICIEGSQELLLASPHRALNSDIPGH